ncbi:ferritin light chain, partial [Lynx pardinus]
ITLRTMFSAILCLWEQLTTFFEFSSLLLINHELPDSSELVHQGGDHHKPSGQYASISLLQLSLGFYYNHYNVAPEGVGCFFHKLAEEKPEGVKCLLKTSRAEAPSSRMCISHPDEWGKTVHAMEAPMVLKKHLNQALFDLHTLGFACVDSYLCDFLEVCFR